MLNQFDKLFPLDFVNDPGAGREAAVTGLPGNDGKEDGIAGPDDAETMNDSIPSARPDQEISTVASLHHCYLHKVASMQPYPALPSPRLVKIVRYYKEFP